MKKALLLVLIIMMFLLSACSDSQKKQTENTTAKVDVDELQKDVMLEKIVSEEQTIEVDNRVVTLPASLFKGQVIDQVIADSKKDGVKEVTKNEDGSLTLKMPNSTYDKMMRSAEQSAFEYIEYLKSGKDYPSIKEVTYNNSSSELTLVVDKDAYENEFDIMSSMGIVVLATYYLISNDTASTEKMKITINVKDESTNETFVTKVFPDNWELK